MGYCFLEIVCLLEDGCSKVCASQVYIILVLHHHTVGDAILSVVAVWEHAVRIIAVDIGFCRVGFGIFACR